jgi:hypothetical protein
MLPGNSGKWQKNPKVLLITSRKLAYEMQIVVNKRYLTANYSIKYRE